MNSLANLDRVNGTIIGEYSRRVALVAPNGRIQRQTHIGASDSPQEWAKAEKDALLASPCGDGKPLSYHPHVIEAIYGKGEWEVRIWD